MVQLTFQAAVFCGKDEIPITAGAAVISPVRNRRVITENGVQGHFGFVFIAEVFCPGIDLFGWLLPGVFQDAALDTAPPQILIDRVGAGIGHGNRNAVFGSIGNLVIACHAPFAHRGNNLEVRCKGVDGDIEAHLVVALARAAVCNCYCSFGMCNFNEQACDKWTG